MLSRFHTIPACHGRTDRRTDRQTDGQTNRIAISISRVSVLTRDKNEKIRVTLCENDAGTLYIVNIKCVLMVREMCKGEIS